MKARLVTVSIVLFAVSSVWAREWKDSTGKSSVEAEYQGMEDTKVILKKPDDKIIKVPVARLSSKDQEYVKLVVLAELKKQLAEAIEQMGAKTGADTTAKAEVLQADAAEKLCKRFNGKLLTLRFPILNVEVAPFAKGLYNIQVDQPDFNCAEEYRFANPPYLKLSKAEVLSINKTSVLMVSGTIRLTYGHKEPAAILTCCSSRNALLNLCLDQATNRIANANDEDNGADARQGEGDGGKAVADSPVEPVETDDVPKDVRGSGDRPAKSGMYYTWEKLSDQNLLVTVHNTRFGDVKGVVITDPTLLPPETRNGYGKSLGVSGMLRFWVNGRMKNPAVTMYFAKDKITRVEWDGQQLRQGSGKGPPSESPSVAPADAETGNAPSTSKAERPTAAPAIRTTTVNWQATVEDYLKTHEKNYTVTKWYPPESVIGASFFRDDAHVWMPVDRPFDGGMLAWAAMGPPGEVAKEQERRREEDKAFEVVRAGKAVRVQYQTDEGFGRSKDHDEIFVVDGNGKFNLKVDTNKFRIGKPEDKTSDN